ncbi:dolichyl-phosphate-mannose-protein mannosyltransferase [Balneicella halophila]|uniref:Dolichyl-phosphate-mannose-protein mannosyltransferase n=1 Tax=Balneicella halophila TaxID=1537566 RepID=A0A7L4UPB5_BALHA|nr:glycosyltransferase family 39 protein [Balneicella halophila]PVX51010.1 dolichyl-phosphate-mannose-protein mannosyltransferase [Balneicella halophila]
MKKSIEQHTFIYLLAVHLFVVLLRCLWVLYGNIDLHTEEAQYWTWSQHLDWSYYSKPPMVAVLNYLSESLFGHSEFSVRINAIIFGFLTSIVTYLFTKELFKDKFTAFVASVLVYAMPFFQGAALFFSTDSPLLFFAIWAMYLGWMSITYDKWKYWILFATAMGLGYLSKYAMLFFIPSIILYLFLTDRKILSNKKLYISLLISFVFFLPVVIWNIKYDFIGFKHLAHLSGAVEHQPNPISRRLSKLLEYVSGQLAIISPLFLVYYFNAFKKNKLDKKAMYLWLPALLSFLMFLITALTKRSGANVNWTMFAYVGLPILLAHYIVQAKKIKPASILFCITIGLFLLATNMRFMDSVGLGNIFPVKIDPLKKMVGWQEVASSIDSLENTLDTERVFIATDSYHITSELRFYNYPKTKYFYANRGNRMTQFSLWDGIEQYENKNYTGIFVTKENLSNKEFKIQPERALPEDIAKAFDKNYTYHTHITYYRGKPVTQFHIYVLEDFKKLPTITVNY